MHSLPSLTHTHMFPRAMMIHSSSEMGNAIYISNKSSPNLITILYRDYILHHLIGIFFSWTQRQPFVKSPNYHIYGDKSLRGKNQTRKNWTMSFTGLCPPFPYSGNKGKGDRPRGLCNSSFLGTFRTLQTPLRHLSKCFLNGAKEQCLGVSNSRPCTAIFSK